MADMKVLDEVGLTYFSDKVDKVLESKVDKVEGKQLSTNDYTDEAKTKLESIDLTPYCTRAEMNEVVTNLRIVQTEYVYTTPSAMYVSFTVPAYTTDGMTVMDVYINGLICVPNVDYTLSGNTVNMTKQLGSDQVCYFIVRSLSVRGDEDGL